VCLSVSLVAPTEEVFPSTLKPLAIHVQLVNRLSLIPGWAGFAAPKPELGVEQKGTRRSPLFYFSCFDFRYFADLAAA
jgi:hypothetical protein